MKKILPCLSALAAVIATTVTLAQSAPPLPPKEGPGEGAAAQAAPPTLNSNLTQVPPSLATDTPTISVGNQLLQQAAGQLERHASITTRLRHQVAIFGQQLYGVGNYWQQGSGETLKVRLEIQIAGQAAQLLQVSNGRFIWTDRTLPTGRNVSRIDLRQLRSDPTLANSNLSEIKPGQANWSTTDLTSYAGGLPTLLRALDENFAFMPPQAMRLKLDPPLTAEATNVPVFAIVGHWKPEKLTALVAKAKAAAGDNGAAAADAKNPQKSLPERIPQEVLLLVGQADMFPYRVEYRQMETPQLSNAGGAPIPYQLSVHPLVVLELSDVVFDASIAPGQFDYAPGNADWTDQTASILEHPRKEKQPEVANRSTIEKK